MRFHDLVEAPILPFDETLKKDFIFLHASTFKVLSNRDLIFENSFEYFQNIIILSKALSKLLPSSK